MADLKISELTSATTPLGGSEVIPVLQGGANRKTTAQAVAALAASTDLSYTAATRTLASSTGADVVLPVATTTDAGLESAADKTKLDSITVDSATVVRKLVRNNSGVNIAKGQPVYQTGSSGTTITVALADASTEATAAQTLGLAQEAIGDNATGWVIAVGELSGVNTATLTEGQIVWLSETTGALTTTRPTQPAHGVVLGYCVKQGSGTSGILYVKVDNGLELDELHDVLISSPTAGQVLRRAADGLWKNATLAAADLTGLATVATTGAYSDLTGRPTLGTAAPLDVAAAGDASASQVVQGNDSRLSDSREWSATTIDQAEAEAGSATTRRAFTAQRVRQAIVAWWATVSGTVAASGSIGTSGLTMATARLLGRSTAGTGAVEEIQVTGATLSGGVLTITSGGTPGGTDGQLQFNSAGSFAGVASSSVDGSGNITLGTRFISSRNGAASAPPVALTGTWFTGGTATTTKPTLLVEPTGTTSTAWSTSGTGLGVNAPSGFTGNLLDLQVNGTSYCKLSNSGTLTTFGGAGSRITLEGVAAEHGFISLRGDPAGNGWYGLRYHTASDSTAISGYNRCVTIGIGGVGANPSYSPRFIFSVGGAALGPTDVPDNTFEARNGVNPQTWRLCNTYTSSTSYERAFFRWLSNVFSVGTEKGSGGGTARAMELQTDGTTRLTFAANGSTITAASGTALVADHRLTGTAPASATATGTTGDIRYDADYIYICTATNTWKRATIATW